MKQGVALALVGLGALLIAGNAMSAIEQQPDGGTTPGNAIDLEMKIQALLATIRQLESGNDYGVIVGGSHFSDFSRHPNRYVAEYNSTAAGAYQFVFRTWETLRSRLGLRDFSPDSQDRAARELLREIGAIQALRDGYDATALQLAGYNRGHVEWEALYTDARGAAATYQAFLG